MKKRVILLMGMLLVLMTALGQFVSCAVVQEQVSTGESQASWQTTRQIVPTDACPEGRHLERGSSSLSDGKGGRGATSSFTLVCMGNTLPHELLTTSEQRLGQRIGQQVSIHVLQCSWLI